MDVQLALSGAIVALFGVEHIAERRKLLLPKKGVDVVWLPEVAEDAFLLHVDVGTIVDRCEKVCHHSLDEVFAAVRQVIIAHKAEVTDRFLVEVNIGAKRVVKLLLTLLPRRHDNFVLRAREDVDRHVANISRVVDLALSEQFLRQRDIFSRSRDRIHF